MLASAGSNSETIGLKGEIGDAGPIGEELTLAESAKRRVAAGLAKRIIRFEPISAVVNGGDAIWVDECTARNTRQIRQVFVEAVGTGICKE